MVPVNVILGAAGTAGFTFGLVRSRLASNRGFGASAGSDDAGAAPQDSVMDVTPTPTGMGSVEDL